MFVFYLLLRYFALRVFRRDNAGLRLRQRNRTFSEVYTGIGTMEFSFHAISIKYQC